MEGCHSPFCLWSVPELDDKETFYFVGHYLGNANPANYRMCFPLKLTKFLQTKILRRPFFAFDGCAQYLTSPTAPHLLARAYAGEKPPLLVACVRRPADQAVSWWNYEGRAMEWGRVSMELDEGWNRPSYPPSTLMNALEYSTSRQVRKLYADAEALADGTFKLPDWAITWPGGQLSGIGRNGAYATNIERYERVFERKFGKGCRYVALVPLEHQSNQELLGDVLHQVISGLKHRSPSSCALVKRSSGEGRGLIVHSRMRSHPAICTEIP